MEDVGLRRGVQLAGIFPFLLDVLQQAVDYFSGAGGADTHFGSFEFLVLLFFAFFAFFPFSDSVSEAPFWAFRSGGGGGGGFHLFSFIGVVRRDIEKKKTGEVGYSVDAVEFCGSGDAVAVVVQGGRGGRERWVLCVLQEREAESFHGRSVFRRR